MLSHKTTINKVTPSETTNISYETIATLLAEVRNTPAPRFHNGLAVQALEHLAATPKEFLDSEYESLNRWMNIGNLKFENELTQARYGWARKVLSQLV